MHIRLQRFYLGLHICKQNFTLLFSATSRTQTGFTRISCLQILSPTASSPSDLAPSIVPCHSRIFTVASAIFSVDPNGTAVLLHCKSDSPRTFLFLLLHCSKLLSFPTHRSAAVKCHHQSSCLKCWELFVVTVAPLFMHVCYIMFLKRKVSKKHVWSTAHINLRGNPQINIGTWREKQIRTYIWQRNNSAYGKTLHV